MDKTWRQAILEEMIKNNDNDILIHYLDNKELDCYIKCDYDDGKYTKNIDFIGWTDKYIYFKSEYDGNFYINSLPIYPDINFKLPVIGGG